MSWFDLLILNTSLLDLICYPVLFTLMVVSFITIWKLSNKVKVLQESVSVLQNTKTEQVDDIPSDADFEVAIAIQNQQIPALGNISATDGEISHVVTSVNKDVIQKVPKRNRRASTENEVPKYSPDPNTPDISEENAKEYITKNVKGFIKSTVDSFPKNWELNKLSQGNLHLLFTLFVNKQDETAKQVTKKLYLLLNPKASES